MSISQLFTPNSYNIFANSLTANSVILPNDSGVKDVLGVSLFNGSSPSGGNIWVQGIHLKTKVFNNTCWVWFSSSTGGFGNGKTGTPTTLLMGDLTNDSVNGYFAPGVFPVADSADGNFYDQYSIQANGANVTAQFHIDSNLGVGANQAQFAFVLQGGATFNNTSSNNNLLNFYFSYPIATS